MHTMLRRTAHPDGRSHRREATPGIARMALSGPCAERLMIFEIWEKRV